MLWSWWLMAMKYYASWFGRFATAELMSRAMRQKPAGLAWAWFTHSKVLRVRLKLVNNRWFMLDKWFRFVVQVLRASSDHDYSELKLFCLLLTFVLFWDTTACAEAEQTGAGSGTIWFYSECLWTSCCADQLSHSFCTVDINHGCILIDEWSQ